MHSPLSITAFIGLAASVQGFAFPDLTFSSLASNGKRALSSVTETFNGAVDALVGRGGEECPAAWFEIAEVLTAQYLADGQCTDAARAAIRAAFHDCFNNGCDGSLILADECSNSENAGLGRVCTEIGNLAAAKDVGVADLIQFAAAHAIKTCPGGPTIPVRIGRKDSSTPAPLGILPQPTQSANSLIALFASKGFTVIDLVALVGAHTAGKQRVTDPSQAGASFDTTPGKWDTQFYKETLNGKAPFTLQSDKALSKAPLSTIPFNAFAKSQGAWAAAFVPAMTKMSLMGWRGGRGVDCTGALPGGSAKRDVKRASVWDRV